MKKIILLLALTGALAACDEFGQYKSADGADMDAAAAAATDDSHTQAHDQDQEQEHAGQ